MKDIYESPLSSRYADQKMKYLFSPDMKFRTWRKLWIALAEAEKELGLPVTQEQIDEMKAHQDDINYDVAEKREKEVRHDVMSHVYAFGVQSVSYTHLQMCVSHVRYSTAGDSVPENAQPLVMRYIKGTLAIAHNGNLTNAHEIRRELEHRGAIFQTTIDSEVIAYIIARERMHSGSIEEAVRRTMPQIQGAYSLLVMSPQKLIAARDPNGFRPLCMGRLGKGYVLSLIHI